MTVFLSIKADIRAAVATLDEAARRQVPFAQARAVTALAFEVQRAERAGMSQVFKHPRPFTQRATLVERATKGYPVATVFVRPEAAKYLAPFEYGGLHHEPGKGLAILEPKALRLDAYGQIRGKPSALAQRPQVFAGKVDGVWGFWQRLRGKGGGPRLKLLVRAAEAMQVHQHLGFVDRARTVIAHRGRAVFDAELSKALATARR